MPGLYAGSIKDTRAPLLEQRWYMQAFIRPCSSDLSGKF